MQCELPTNKTQISLYVWDALTTGVHGYEPTCWTSLAPTLKWMAITSPNRRQCREPPTSRQQLPGQLLGPLLLVSGLLLLILGWGRRFLFV